MNRNELKKTVGNARLEILYFGRWSPTELEAKVIEELKLQTRYKSNDQLLTDKELSLYWQLFDFIDARLSK